LELGTPATVERVEIDTSFFRGNAPGSVTVEVCDELAAGGDHTAAKWASLLPDTPLQADALHVFADELSETRHARFVRMSIFPDGGVARLRLLGTPDAVAQHADAVARFDALDAAEARAALLDCCHSEAWADALLATRPFGDLRELLSSATQIWRALDKDAWREAFAAHPEIGAAPSGDGTAARWASAEQAGTASADDDVRQRLADGNRAYRARHGFVFLVCATGRSPEHMLALLERRLGHDTDCEIDIAAEEQRRITTLRLLKLLGDS
jgi:allantoicase